MQMTSQQIDLASTLRLPENPRWIFADGVAHWHDPDRSLKCDIDPSGKVELYIWERLSVRGAGVLLRVSICDGKIVFVEKYEGLCQRDHCKTIAEALNLLEIDAEVLFQADQ